MKPSRFIRDNGLIRLERRSEAAERLTTLDDNPAIQALLDESPLGEFTDAMS